MRKGIIIGIMLLAILLVGCTGNTGSKEQVLVSTMDKILTELSIDPSGKHEILSRSFDVDGDSLSASVEVRVDGASDLNALKDQILSRASGWKGGDVSLGGDSLDISFEKDYPVVEIEGVKYIPSSSVTISVTVEDDGFTDADYDIDITLEEAEIETESEKIEVDKIEAERDSDDEENE